MRSVMALRAVLVALALGGAAQAWAQGTPLQSQESNASGVVAELMECTRSDGVLTVKVRLRNTTDTDAGLLKLVTGPADYDSLYVVAAARKYLVLRDSEKVPLAVAPNSGPDVWVFVPKKGAFIWWGKYPAPPPEVKRISYVTTFSGPFENIPITDR